MIGRTAKLRTVWDGAENLDTIINDLSYNLIQPQMYFKHVFIDFDESKYIQYFCCLLIATSGLLPSTSGLLPPLVKDEIKNGKGRFNS